MYKYTLRRLMLAVPVLLLSSLIVFGLMRVMPGDALTVLMAESGNIGEKELQKLRKDLRLDLPYHEQYLLWLWQMVSLRPGDSLFTGEPISTSLWKAPGSAERPRSPDLGYRRDRSECVGHAAVTPRPTTWDGWRSRVCRCPILAGTLVSPSRRSGSTGLP
jgi:hypothetical protein